MSDKHGIIVKLPDDFLTRDYTQECLDYMRAAGERRAWEEERAILEAVLGPLPEPPSPEPDVIIGG